MLNTVHFSRGKPDFGTNFTSGLVLREQGVALVVQIGAGGCFLMWVWGKMLIFVSVLEKISL